MEKLIVELTQISLQVAHNIKRARRETGMSQRDLAERLGYSNTTISRIEAGTRKIGIDDLYQLAQVLGKPFGFFLDGSSLLGSQHGIITELRTVERVVVPVWDKVTLNTEGKIVCYAYFAPGQIKGRNVVGLWFRGITLDGEINNGDVIFFDTLSKLSNGRLVLAVMNGTPVIMRCITKNGELALQYSGGFLSLNMVDVKGVIIEVRRRLV